MKTLKQALILSTLVLSGTAALADDITLAQPAASTRTRDAVLMDLRQAQVDGTLIGGGELAPVRMAPRPARLSAGRQVAGRFETQAFATLYGAP